MFVRQLFASLLVIATLQTFVVANLLSLRGVTVFKAPFVEYDNSTGKLKGFFVDLLDELSRVGKFNYTLENLRTPQNSMLQDNYPSLLISDVLNNKADFALADSLFKADNYVRYANFTQPYIVSGFSALVQRSLLERDNIDSFEELLEKTRKVRPELPPYAKVPAGGDIYGQPGQEESAKPTEAPKSDIEIGTISSSAAYRILTMATDPIGRQVYERLIQHSENLVESRKAGVARVQKRPYAFIQEAFNNELEVDENCELTHLILKPTADAAKPIPQLEYSLAVRKRYIPLDMLNKAIEDVRKSGKLEELKQKYWNRKCNTAPRSLSAIAVTLFSLALSLFLLS